VELAVTPAEVYERPASPFVIRVLGAVNGFHGRGEGGRAYVRELAFAAPGADGRGGAHVYVRPRDIDVHRARVPGSFSARLERLVPLGGAVRLELSAPGHAGPLEVELEPRLAAALALVPGETVHLAPRRVRVFPAEGEEAVDSLTASGL
jgi:sulfate transport system ATP-binding protein